jgi:hypothetical protein
MMLDDEDPGPVIEFDSERRRRMASIAALDPRRLRAEGAGGTRYPRISCRGRLTDPEKKLWYGRGQNRNYDTEPLRVIGGRRARNVRRPSSFSSADVRRFR